MTKKKRKIVNRKIANVDVREGSKASKGNNKWVTLYKPANLGVVNMIEESHKHMGIKDKDGNPISLGKFIIFSALRDIQRTIQMAEAHQAEMNKEVPSETTEESSDVEESTEMPVPQITEESDDAID